MTEPCKYLGRDGVTCYGWMVGYCRSMIRDRLPEDPGRVWYRCGEATGEVEEARRFMRLEDNEEVDGGEVD